MMAVGAEGRRKKHEDDIVQQAHELDKQRVKELRKTAYAKLTEEERDALFKTGW